MFESIKKLLANPDVPMSEQLMYDEIEGGSSFDWRKWNDEYYRSQHWQATIKIFRRAAKGCLVCKMTDEEHRDKFRRHLETHHRNYNHKGWERWCDLEVMCSPCHKAEQAGEIIIADYPPTFPSIEPIHPDEPEPMFPDWFGWPSIEEQQARSAREREAAAKRAESRPLQIAEQVKETYAKPAPAPPPQPEPVPPLVQVAQNLRDKQEVTFRAFDKAVTEVLDEYTRKFWNPMRNAFTAMREGEIAPEHMRKIVAHYQHHIHAEIDQLTRRQDEMVIAVPQYTRVGVGKLEAKYSRTFPQKANGRAEDEG